MAIQNPKLNTSFLSKKCSDAWTLFGKGGWHLFVGLVFSVSAFGSDSGLDSQENSVRIVSLSPAITEALYDLDLGKYIVGTSSFSNYPESAKHIPTVGSYLQPSIEKIIRLKPTHVLVFKEGDPSIEKSLQNAKLNFITLESRSLDDYESMIKKLGSTFNAEKKSEEILGQWKNQWSKLENVPRTKEKILIQIDHMPIFIAGHDTFISKAFERCGFENAFNNIEGYKKVQLETIMNRKPEIIIVVGMVDQTGNFNTVRAFWHDNPITKNAKIIKGDGDILSRLSLRLPKEVIKVCSQLKPLKASE